MVGEGGFSGFTHLAFVRASNETLRKKIKFLPHFLLSNFCFLRKTAPQNAT